MKIRIISGIYKGRMINVPKSDNVRPTTDRVRETLFNILANRINFENIKVLDLYAGSGSLGIEALSRGASEVYFVEKNFSFYNNIKSNLLSLGITSGYTLLNIEAVAFIRKKYPVKFDLLFADPPYKYTELYEMLNNENFQNLFSTSAIKVIERSSDTIKEDTQAFGAEPVRVIGNTCLYFL